MILNEDFFNDIEINDEDLTDEYTAEKHVEEYNEKTSRELIEHKISESEMVLMILIDYFDGDSNILWHRIERIMKRLKYMLNMYNINISEPFLMYKDVSFKILKDKEFPHKNANFILIQHEGCNLYFKEDILSSYGPDGTIRNELLSLFVFLDKKVPVFKTARRAYNFVINLNKCIWKDVTNPKYECFCWCIFYDINDVYNDAVIESYPDSNSYVIDNATRIYKSVLNIVPEEVAK